MFIHDDFMLDSNDAVELYRVYARNQPIIDYHCHLIPAEIAENKRWENITQIWLYGDHYKWRLMRAAGIPEEYCSGNASDYDKFAKYAELMPQAIRNPLYHWSHMELKEYFGVTKLLGPDTADEIWGVAKERIQSPEFTARSLMKRSGVEVVCTTDDPVDTLEHHRLIAADKDFDIRVLPTWRPDNALAVDKPDVFRAWLEKLECAADVAVASLADFLSAIRKRHDFFAENGCVVSDRGIAAVVADDFTESSVAATFGKAISGKPLSTSDIREFQSYMLHELALMDAEKGWATQIHYGVMRNNNTVMLEKAGPDSGFDSIGDYHVAEAMAKHFDRLNYIGKLPKTIIYPINPSDNELVATMIGNFQDGLVPGKMQFGAAWWFLDQIDGMTRQIEALSQLGLLSRFVGMLTDSRSFLSYVRHDYFRRLLCNILGEDMKRGLVPRDMELVGGMVADICYHNAKHYFGITE